MKIKTSRSAVPAATSDTDAVLRRLVEPRSVGRVTGTGGLAVYVARNRFASPAAVVTPEVLSDLTAQGWIAAREGNAAEFEITRQGRAYLQGLNQDDYPYRSQHQIIRRRMEKVKDGEPGLVRVNEAETPLGWLVNRKGRDGRPLISGNQFAAGERLRRDFTLACLSPRVTAMWGLPVSDSQRGGGNDAANQSDNVIAAKARVWAAFDAAGPGLGTILLQVCCYLNGLEEAEKNLNWPARSGKIVLGIALDRLVEHYGMDRGGAPKQCRRVFLAGEDGVRKKKLHNT